MRRFWPSGAGPGRQNARAIRRERHFGSCAEVRACSFSVTERATFISIILTWWACPLSAADSLGLCWPVAEMAQQHLNESLQAPCLFLQPLLIRWLWPQHTLITHCERAEARLSGPLPWRRNSNRVKEGTYESQAVRLLPRDFVVVFGEAFMSVILSFNLKFPVKYILEIVKTPISLKWMKVFHQTQCNTTETLSLWFTTQSRLFGEDRYYNHCVSWATDF